jgi:integrase
VTSYDRAIAKACNRAFPPPPELAHRRNETPKDPQTRAELQAWRRRHRWTPNQLRHTKATEIRREAGLDAARAVLGHRSPAITEVYAELDTAKAAEIMERLG